MAHHTAAPRTLGTTGRWTGVPPLLRAHHKHQQCPRLLMGTPRDSRAHPLPPVSHGVTAPDPAAPGILAFQLVTGLDPSAPRAHNASSVPRELPTSVLCFSPSKWLVPPQCIPPLPPLRAGTSLGLLPGTWALKWGSLTDAPQLPLGTSESRRCTSSSDAAAPSRPPAAAGPHPGDGSAGKLGSPGWGRGWGKRLLA